MSPAGVSGAGEGTGGCFYAWSARMDGSEMHRKDCAVWLTLTADMTFKNGAVLSAGTKLLALRQWGSEEVAEYNVFSADIPDLKVRENIPERYALRLRPGEYKI